ncbi:hypothetical protein RCL1_001152 [Eukaryota sp. TZLM3-RCL]
MGFFTNLVNREPEPTSFLDSIGDSLSLSKKTRFYGFIITFAVGFVCGFFAIMMLPSAIVTGKSFAFLYAVGHLCAIGSTCFLLGPMKQLKKMFKPDRIMATTAYLVSVFLVLILALRGLTVILLLPLVIVSFCCLLYYIASYFPFGRRMLRSVATSALSV